MFARPVQIILIAALFGFFSVGTGLAEGSLSERQLRIEILDQAFQYEGVENGELKEGRIFYKNNGRMFIVTRQGVLDAGTWKIAGSNFCTRVLLGRNNQEVCFKIYEFDDGRYPTSHGYSLYPIQDKSFEGV